MFNLNSYFPKYDNAAFAKFMKAQLHVQFELKTYA